MRANPNGTVPKINPSFVDVRSLVTFLVPTDDDAELVAYIAALNDVLEFENVSRVQDPSGGSIITGSNHYPASIRHVNDALGKLTQHFGHEHAVWSYGPVLTSASTRGE